LSGCASTRSVPDGKHLLCKNTIKTDRPELKENFLAVIKQKPNRKIFGFIRFHLSVYNFAFKGKETKFNHWLKTAVGEEPVLVDTMKVRKSREQLLTLLQNNGYFNAEASDSIEYYKKKSIVYYNLYGKTPYTFRKLKYEIKDSLVEAIVLQHDMQTNIHLGDNYSAGTLQKERDRITTLLRNSGFAAFNSQYIRFIVDTGFKSNNAEVTMVISNPNPTEDQIKNAITPKHLLGINKKISIDMDYEPIDINRVAVTDSATYNDYVFYPNRDTVFLYKFNRLTDHIYVQPNSLYSQENIDLTYQRLADLGVFRFVNIKYDQLEGTDSLGRNLYHCKIMLSPQLRQSYKFEAEGTNSGGNLGISGSFVYRNKNVFRGAELLEFKIRGGLEIQRSLTTQESQAYKFGLFNTFEFGPELSLSFPRGLWPFTIRNSRKVSNPITSVSIGYNVQSRPEYFRRLANLSYYYTKRTSKYNRFYFYPAEINYLKVDLDTAFNRQLLSYNNINLLNSYTDQLIINGRFSYLYNNQIVGKIGNFTFFRFNIEFAGNTLSLLPTSTYKISETNSRLIGNVRYAQYVRPDFDFRYYLNFNKTSALVTRFVSGLGYAYGNSTLVPFEKAFYAGGPNDIRAWRSRSLGPGSNVTTDLFQQFGEFKITGNVEYRFNLYKFLKGAVFTDAGNIWLLNDVTDKPGATVRIKTFGDEIAIGSGIGLRGDFTFFIFRLDAALKMKDPSKPIGSRWVAGQNNLSDLTFNFGIGYPF
ncbi:MAG: BamA/TamA family outer membrane protein, partial [Bacteroidota bacterium]